MAFDGVVNEEVIFNELPTECEHFGLIKSMPTHVTAALADSNNTITHTKEGPKYSKTEKPEAP